MKIGKKGAGQFIAPFVIVMIVALALVAGAGITKFLDGKSNDNPLAAVNDNDNSGDSEKPQLDLCGSDTTPDIDINGYDSENPGTALTETTNLYRKVGNTAWSTWTQGTAITNLEVGSEYEFVMGITTSDFTDNAYGPYFTKTVKCQEIESVDKALFNDEDEGSLTATFYNANHDAGAETFSAGVSQNVYFEWNAGSDEVCGNQFIKDSGLPDNGKHSVDMPNVICLDLNSTEWDAPESMKVDGMSLDLVPTPTRHSASTGIKTYCYEAPVLTESITDFTARINPDDSNAPSIDGTAYFYCGNFYIGKSGELAWGVENEEGTAVGTDAADSLTLDFTA